MYKLPYLQKYKGKSTRYKCPSCGRNQSFTLYLDGITHEPIHCTVGRCNREIKCGYHYTPQQFFADNCTDAMLGVSNIAMHSVSKFKVIKPPCPIGTIPFSYLIDSLSPNSNFVSFLQQHFSEEIINTVFENYLLGATKNQEVIFWQIDIQGKVRTGKIMQYNPKTGKRIKHQSGAIDWVHNKLKKSRQLPEDFNLQQCFFGEHLLKIYPDKTVAIVESEKSACIASCVIPELIWLAAGSLNGLSFEKCKVLKNRNVILYPDLGAYMRWNTKAAEIQNRFDCIISISTLLNDIASPSEITHGLDVVDYLFVPSIK